MQFLSLSWLVLRLTDSSSQLGLVIFLFGISNLALLIFGGTLADRIDRRWLLVSSQAALVILTFTLATLTITNLVALWHILFTAIILGAIEGLTWPARFAIVDELVNRDEMVNAIALNNVAMSTGRIVGPAVGGSIIEFADTGSALYVTAGCFMIAIVFILLMRRASSLSRASKTSVLRDLWEGVHLVWTTPVALTLIAIGFAFGLFAFPYMEVLPAFAKKVLEVGAGEAGLLLSAIGIGSVLGNLTLASLGDFQHKNWLLLGTAFTFGVSLILFAWSPWYWVSWGILLLAGLGSISFITLGTAVLQLTMPSELHGRVLSLWAIGGALHYIGALPMGVVADLLSWPISIAGGSALFLLVAIWLGVGRPTLRQMKV